MITTSSKTQKASGRSLVGDLFAVVLLVLVVSGTWWWHRDGGQSDAFEPSANRIPLEGTTASSAMTVAGGDNSPSPVAIVSSYPDTGSTLVNDNPESGDGNSAAHVSANSSRDLQVPAVDFTQTSWENPFSASNWISTGWTFDGRSMSSTRDGKPATATFGRNYTRLTLDCGVAPLSDDHPAATFSVVLTTAETDTEVSVNVSATAVSVRSEQADEQQILAERRIDSKWSAARPLPLRMTFTGDRILIASGPQVLINCEQPAAQSGRELSVALAADGPLRISSLRLEGE